MAAHAENQERAIKLLEEIRDLLEKGVGSKEAPATWSLTTSAESASGPQPESHQPPVTDATPVWVESACD